MMTTVKGYYNGTTFVFDEDIQIDVGQEVFMTLIPLQTTDAGQKRPPIDFSKFVGIGEKMFTTDAQDYIRELRDNDRV